MGPTEIPSHGGGQGIFAVRLSPCSSPPVHPVSAPAGRRGVDAGMPASGRPAVEPRGCASCAAGLGASNPAPMQSKPYDGGAARLRIRSASLGVPRRRGALIFGGLAGPGWPNPRASLRGDWSPPLSSRRGMPVHEAGGQDTRGGGMDDRMGPLIIEAAWNAEAGRPVYRIRWTTAQLQRIGQAVLDGDRAFLVGLEQAIRRALEAALAPQRG
jgi:hypothetical protein